MGSDKTDIDLLELQKAINMLFEHVIVTRKIESITLQDFYWDILEDERFDLTKEPSRFAAGNLFDEWRFAQNLVDGTSPPVAYQFCQVAPILMYLGHVLGKRLSGEGG